MKRCPREQSYFRFDRTGPRVYGRRFIHSFQLGDDRDARVPFCSRRRSDGCSLVRGFVGGPGSGRAGHQAVRAECRTARQGRGVGAHAAGARREDARPGQGHAAGLPDRPRVGRRPHGHHGRQARPEGPRHRIQPRHGRTVEAQRRPPPASRDKATFVKADLFESDFSKAQVITMFLLPSINLRLRPTILNMKPGTRIVSNSFTMDNWQADETATVTERLHQLVHGLPVDRAGQGRGHVAARHQHAHAHPGVPGARRHDGLDADQQRRA